MLRMGPSTITLMVESICTNKLINCLNQSFKQFSIMHRMNFLSNILREEGGFEYKKAIVDSILILVKQIPDAKDSGLSHLCEFIEDCEFSYLSTQVMSSLVRHLSCSLSSYQN